MPDSTWGAGLTQIVGGAETDDTALVPCILVHPCPGSAIKRHFVPVAGKEILAEIFRLSLEEKSQTPNDGIVTQDRMLLPGYILDEPEHDDPDRDQAKDRAKTVETTFSTSDMTSSTIALG
ncbi:MAG: hypothetical protein ABIN99_00810 [Nitrosospira sp.]